LSKRRHMSRKAIVENGETISGEGATEINATTTSRSAEGGLFSERTTKHRKHMPRLNEEVLANEVMQTSVVTVAEICSFFANP